MMQNLKRTRLDRAGFTLLETILVILLIGLTMSLVVLNAERIFGDAEYQPPAERLALAVREARYRAALERQPVRLSFDPEEARFEVSLLDGESIAWVSLESGLGSEEPVIAFYGILPQKGAPEPFNPDRPSQRARISHAVFSVTQGSTPFVAEIRYRGQTEWIQFDPFSSIQFRADPR